MRGMWTVYTDESRARYGTRVLGVTNSKFEIVETSNIAWARDDASSETANSASPHYGPRGAGRPVVSESSDARRCPASNRKKQPPREYIPPR